MVLLLHQLAPIPHPRTNDFSLPVIAVVSLSPDFCTLLRWGWKNNEWKNNESISENFPLSAELSFFWSSSALFHLEELTPLASSRCSLLSFLTCPPTDKESRAAAHDRTSFSAWFRHEKREAAQHRLFSAEFGGK